MRALFALIALTVRTGLTHAASCDEQATEKKLAGAAKSSFVKKCEKDSGTSKAGADCDAKAAEKKLAGAAKKSFVKKCVADAGAAK
jgi:hypothetical protein